MLIGLLLVLMLQLLIAMLSSPQLVYFVLLSSAFPLFWVSSSTVSTFIGQLDYLAIRVLGLCVVSVVAVLRNINAETQGISRLKWHFVFLLFCLFSIAYAPSGVYGFRMLFKLAGPLLVVLMVLAVIKTRMQLLAMQGAILASGAIIMIVSVVIKMMGISSDPNSQYSGVVGLGPPGMGPPVFAAHLLPVFSLALAAYVCERKAWLLFFTCATGLCIFLAFERTSILAMFCAGSIVLFFGSRGWARYFLPLAGVVGAPLLFLSSPVLRRRMFYGDIGSSSIGSSPGELLANLNSSGRFGLWDQMLDMFFKPRPIFGSGVGATQEYLYAQTSGGIGVVHSEYIRLLCEVGVVGLVLFIVMIAFYFSQIRKGLPYVKGGDGNLELSKFSLAATGALVSYLVFMLTDNALDYVTQFGAYVFSLIAMAIKAYELTYVSGHDRVDVESINKRAGVLPINLMK